MPPDQQYLIEKAGLSLPLIGVYDAPEVAAFEPLCSPQPGKWACPFMFFKSWQRGQTLLLTHECYGCGGAGTSLFDQQTRTREEYVDFLYG
ncbi:MAG: hypothetical protein P9M14_02455 [Candidatus Alcyoniella australis]|nr:hypothetical protein [Candidatus Alcyoniella australis]